ncbi:hypothetical protein BDR07DRAFT_1378791 [Suillus spraguei]|nr:hypothetical protein BDR07DRAFT_1378791 [Suillus spraguei]
MSMRSRATRFIKTYAQEKSLSRDYPLQDHDPADPALSVQRTYLHFLWLPHSIMPHSISIPSLLRIRRTPDLAEDQPHPLHVFIEPLLLSLRAAANKYHDDLPQIFADGGGAGEAEESMMWYALGYEKVDPSAERSEHINREDRKEKERAASVGTTQDKALQLVLTRQINMSRAWKGKDLFCNVMDEDEDAEEENWLPNSSPDVLPLSKSEWVRGSKKRVPSAASEVLASDTPVRKRMRLGKKRYFVLQVVKCEADNDAFGPEAIVTKGSETGYYVPDSRNAQEKKNTQKTDNGIPIPDILDRFVSSSSTYKRRDAIDHVHERYTKSKGGHYPRDANSSLSGGIPQDRVVIDPGSRIWKVGFSGEGKPRDVFYADPKNYGPLWSWSRATDPAEKVEQDNMLAVNLERCLLAEPKARKDMIAHVLFSNLQVPSIPFASSHLLSLLSIGRIAGLVLDCGHLESTAFPVRWMDLLHDIRSTSSFPQLRTTPLAGYRFSSHIRALLLFGSYLPPPATLSAAVNVPPANRTTRVPQEIFTDAVIEDIKTRRCCSVSDALESSLSDVRASSPAGDDPSDNEPPPSSDPAMSESEFSRGSIGQESAAESEFSIISNPIHPASGGEARHENHLQVLANMYMRHSTPTDLHMRVVPPASQQTGTGRGTLIIPGWVREHAAEVLFEGGDLDESSVAEVILDALIKSIDHVSVTGKILGMSVLSETRDTIQKYSEVFNMINIYKIKRRCTRNELMTHSGWRVGARSNTWQSKKRSFFQVRIVNRKHPVQSNVHRGYNVLLECDFRTVTKQHVIAWFHAFDASLLFQECAFAREWNHEREFRRPADLPRGLTRICRSST